MTKVEFNTALYRGLQTTEVLLEAAASSKNFTEALEVVIARPKDVDHNRYQDIDHVQFADVLSKDSNCWLCDLPMVKVRRSLSRGYSKIIEDLSRSRDHVLPKSKGGKSVGNIKYAHRLCNSIRSSNDVTDRLRHQCRMRILAFYRDHFLAMGVACEALSEEEKLAWKSKRGHKPKITTHQEPKRYSDLGAPLLPKMSSDLRASYLARAEREMLLRLSEKAPGP